MWKLSLAGFPSHCSWSIALDVGDRGNILFAKNILCPLEVVSEECEKGLMLKLGNTFAE